jgi:hypothetical protein
MSPQNISRRQLLKSLLITTSGLTAVAFVPQKWIRPVVKAGVLPVHAATSKTTSYEMSINGTPTAGTGTFTIHNLNVYIYDTLTGDPGANIEVRVENCVPTATLGTLTATCTFPLSYHKTDASGKYTFDDIVFNTTCSSSSVRDGDVQLTVRSKTGLTSGERFGYTGSC